MENRFELDFWKAERLCACTGTFLGWVHGWVSFSDSQLGTVCPVWVSRKQWMSYRSPRRAYTFPSLFLLQHLLFSFHLFSKPCLGIPFPEIPNSAWVSMTDHLEQLRLLWWVERAVWRWEEKEKDSRTHSLVSRVYSPSLMNECCNLSKCCKLKCKYKKDAAWRIGQVNSGRCMERLKGKHLRKEAGEDYQKE